MVFVSCMKPLAYKTFQFYFKDTSVRGQNNSKYCDLLLLNKASFLLLFRAKVQKKLDDFEVTSFEELRRVNDQMIKMERAFIYSYGLPGRRLVRHVIFAPSKYNLYGSSSFPGVSDILFKLDETGDEDEVDRQISIARQCILAAVDILTPYE